MYSRYEDEARAVISQLERCGAKVTLREITRRDGRQQPQKVRVRIGKFFAETDEQVTWEGLYEWLFYADKWAYNFGLFKQK